MTGDTAIKLVAVHTPSGGSGRGRGFDRRGCAQALRETGVVGRWVVNPVRDRGEATGQTEDLSWPDAPAFVAISEIWAQTPAGVDIVADALHRTDRSTLLYQVDTTVQKGSLPSAPTDGRPVPGVKNLFMVRRAAQLGRSDFRPRWLQGHVPLALRHHVGMSRYVTDVVVQSLTADAPEVDGFATLCFATEDEFRDGMFDNEHGREVIEADVNAFLSGTVGTRVDEYVGW